MFSRLQSSLYFLIILFSQVNIFKFTHTSLPKLKQKLEVEMLLLALQCIEHNLSALKVQLAHIEINRFFLYYLLSEWTIWHFISWLWICLKIKAKSIWISLKRRNKFCSWLHSNYVHSAAFTSWSFSLPWQII